MYTIDEERNINFYLFIYLSSIHTSQTQVIWQSFVIFIQCYYEYTNTMCSYPIKTLINLNLVMLLKAVAFSAHTDAV